MRVISLVKYMWLIVFNASDYTEDNPGIKEGSGAQIKYMPCAGGSSEASDPFGGSLGDVHL